MKLEFYTLDVFTERVLSGNPLAVVLDAESLDDARMQSIAREFNLSETVFVMKPLRESAAARVRIFTPDHELPFAGHPTVGTACLLSLLQRVPAGAETRIVLEEGVGDVPVLIRRDAGRPLFAQLTTAGLPSFGPPAPSAADIAEVLGLDAADVMEHALEGPRGASCGVPFLLVPLATRAALARARLRVDRWEALLSGYWAKQLFLYCREPESPLAHYRTRMFAPDMGIGEDPATGSAAVAFCGALAAVDTRRDGTLAWTLEQGYEMGRPSQLYIEADKLDGAITAVRVGGYAVPVSSGVLEI